MNRFRYTILPILGALLFSGCASYELGHPGSDQDSYKSVYVKPIRNDSTYPMLKASLTASIRRAIADTGFLELESAETAETVLETRVISVKREIAAVSSIDVGRGRKYELEFETLCSLYSQTENGLSPIFIDRRILSKQDIFADGGQVDAEHQAGPEIARKIARRVAETVLDTW